MIPLSKNQHFEYKDEKTGIIFLFRYLTGEKADEWDKIQKNNIVDDSLLKKASKAANAKIGKRKISISERAEIVSEEIGKLSPDTSDNNFSFCRDIVDLFLVGWKGKNVPDVPKDCKMSECLKYGDLVEMARIITGQIPELTGVGVTEAKN